MTKSMAYIILADRPYLNILREAAAHLMARGHRVDVTGNGTQVGTLAEQEQPDVVALSFFLNGADGFQTAKEVRRLYPDDKTQLLWITVITEEGQPAISWTDATFANFLLQPYSAWHLVLAVEQLLYRRIEMKSPSSN